MIRKKLTIMIVLLMFATLTAGCSKNTEMTARQVEQPQSEIKRNNTTQKDKDKHITLCESWGFEEGFYTVRTPGNSTSFGSVFYLGNFYETLVNYEGGKIVPGLATSWNISDDGLTYTFVLKEGVKFSDGAEFDAEVVKKNLEMIPILSGNYNGIYAYVTTLFKEVKVIGKYKVEVRLSSPYYGALQDFAKLNPLSIMSPNAFNEDGGVTQELLNATLGTGPYMFDGQTDGNAYTFIRNPYYIGNKPDVDQFAVKVIPDNESKALALRSGEIDMIFGTNKIAHHTFNEFSEDKGYRAKASNESTKTRFVGFNLTQAPFDDKNVRLAASYAIDKQSLCDHLFYGIEKKADTFFSQSLPYCNVAAQPYGYDVNKANDILEKSGWKDLDGDGIREKNGKRLAGEILYVSGRASTDNLVLTLALSLKEIGMDIQVTGLEVMAWYGKLQEGDFSIVYRETYGIPNDPYTLVNNMNPDASSDILAVQSLAHLDNSNEIIRGLTHLVDENDIQDRYDFILNEIHMNIPFLPLSEMKEFVIYNTKEIMDYDFNGQPSNMDVSGIILK